MTPMVPENGILARVPGQYIASGSRQLPSAGEDQKDQPARGVLVEVPDLGWVRITYRLNTYRHGKSRHWHWVAAHAAHVPPEAAAS